MPNASVDIGTILLSLGGSGALALFAVKWFGERSVDHAFARRLEAYKSELSRATGDEAAEREYRFEARKRLASVIGPLRFQLLQAAILYRDRISAVARFKYAVSMQRYFGRSTLYRIGRLLALIELIERQAVYLDFSVDASMIDLMRFRAGVFDALSDGRVVLDHPDADWTQQVEHLFRDEITVIATAMMTQPVGEGIRVIRVDEFNAVLGDASTGFLEPLTGQISRLNPTTTPVLWLRLVAVAALCDALVSSEPLAKALGGEAFDHAQLLDASGDAYITSHRAEYASVIGGLRAPFPARDATDRQS